MARLSPWVFAGIGCLGVAALGVVALGGVGLLVSKSVKEELSKPLDKVALLRDLNVPIHPKAELDEKLTQTMHAGTVLAEKWAKLSLASASFRLLAPEEEVRDWYKKTLVQKGYPLTEETKGKTRKLQFTSKEYIVTVDFADPALMTITRMKVPGTNKE